MSSIRCDIHAGTLELPFKLQLSTLSQFESARPFTLTTPFDVNTDGLDTNDRAVINGVQTKLDQFRGTPFAQVDLRVSREFRLREHVSIRPFAEFFNLFNRSNPGNNFITDLGALPVPADQQGNATDLCLNAKTKAAKRKLALSERAYNVLQRRINDSKIEGQYLFPGRGEGDKPIVKINNAHTAAVKRSGIAPFKLYALRHTFATRAAQAGVDLVTLASLLGHSRLTMVTRYAHPTEEHQFEAMRKVAAYTRKSTQR